MCDQVFTKLIFALPRHKSWINLSFLHRNKKQRRTTVSGNAKQGKDIKDKKSGEKLASIRDQAGTRLNAQPSDQQNRPGTSLQSSVDSQTDLEK